MDTTILHHPKSKRICKSCQITFRPAHPRHTRCGPCHAYWRIFKGTMQARRGLLELPQ